VSSSVEGDRPRQVSGDAYTEVQHSERFQELRRKHRSFVFPVTAIYVSYANKNLDPLAAELRDELEGGAR
jgi:uncharacterized membrane protein (DUF485 family)